jgi:hypothetical protein
MLTGHNHSPSKNGGKDQTRLDVQALIKNVHYRSRRKRKVMSSAVWHIPGEQVYKFLNSLEVLWSTNPVCFAVKGGKPVLYLWVGVNPNFLSSSLKDAKDAKAAAIGCKEILTSS